MKAPALSVRLTPAEQRIVQWVALQRHQANRDGGVVDAQVGPQSATLTDRDGFGAELAFCKLFNVYPDLDTAPRRGTADCTRFGETIDIKATRYPQGRLLAVTRKRELAADCYALMIAAWPRFTFAGFVRAADLFAPGRLLDLGHGPTYAVDQSDPAMTEEQFR